MNAHLPSRAALAALACLALAAHAQEKEMAASGGRLPPVKSRFEVTDRAWPEKAGDASVCLWKDDAIAALSLTVDDNTAPDHPWWLEMSAKHGLRVTWFVITGRVSKDNAYFGTWEGFRKLLAAGHDVQSHTVTHLHKDEAGWGGVEWEYAESKKALETNLPGHRALALAYPGGQNSSLNDPSIAAKYYLGCRGTTGSMNPADRINYLQTNSLGALNLDESPFESQNLKAALEKGAAKNKSLYRAWYCAHFHQVKPEAREKTEKAFAYVSEKVKAGELWLGLFAEVIRYGQERDSATVKTVEAGAQQVRLALADGVEDARFDFPLTLKVRLPDGWATATAKQAEKAVPARVVENEGKKYALVDAVPDRGEIVLQP
jgi:hypothetical protein